MAIVVLTLPGVAGASSLTLGQHWSRSCIEPGQFFGPHEVIDFARESLRFNNVSLNETQVLDTIRSQKDLVPRPMIFLRFAAKDIDGARALARKIRGASGCDPVCQYLVIDRPREKSTCEVTAVASNKVLERSGEG